MMRAKGTNLGLSYAKTVGELLKYPTKRVLKGRGDYKYKDINPLWLETQMSQVMKSTAISNALSIAMGVYNELASWISSYQERSGTSKGFSDFQWHWKLARNFVGLQVRLVCEQVLWDMGPPWNSLNTGFKAVGESKTRGNGTTASVAGQGAIGSTTTSSSSGTASGRPPTGEAKGSRWV